MTYKRKFDNRTMAWKRKDKLSRLFFMKTREVMESQSIMNEAFGSLA